MSIYVHGRQRPATSISPIAKRPQVSEDAINGQIRERPFPGHSFPRKIRRLMSGLEKTGHLSNLLRYFLRNDWFAPEIHRSPDRAGRRLCSKTRHYQRTQEGLKCRKLIQCAAAYWMPSVTVTVGRYHVP